MRHAISLQHIRSHARFCHESLLYAVAKPSMPESIANQKRSTRSRMEDYAERQWMKLDNTFLE